MADQDKQTRLVALDMRTGVTYIGFTDDDIVSHSRHSTELRDYVVVETTTLVGLQEEYQHLARKKHQARQIGHTNTSIYVSNDLEARMAIHDLTE